jgi:hypothetical protein
MPLQEGHQGKQLVDVPDSIICPSSAGSIQGNLRAAPVCPLASKGSEHLGYAGLAADSGETDWSFQMSSL